MNQYKSGSLLEYDVTEQEVPHLEDRLDYTLLLKDDEGWTPAS